VKFKQQIKTRTPDVNCNRAKVNAYRGQHCKSNCAVPDSQTNLSSN